MLNKTIKINTNPETQIWGPKFIHNYFEELITIIVLTKTTMEIIL